MGELNPEGRRRWYARPGKREGSCLWAQRFFSSHHEAYAYYEQEVERIGPDRVYLPVRSPEDPNVWAVCVDPQ